MASIEDLRLALVDYCYSELVSLDSLCSSSFVHLLNLIHEFRNSQSSRELRSNISKRAKEKIGKETCNYNSLEMVLQKKYDKVKINIKNEIYQCFSRYPNQIFNGTILSEFHEPNLFSISLSIINENWQIKNHVMCASTSVENIDDISQFISTTINDFLPKKQSIGTGTVLSIDFEKFLNQFFYVTNGGQFVSCCNLIQLPSMIHQLGEIIDLVIFGDGQHVQLIENCLLISGLPCRKISSWQRNWLWKFKLFDEILVTDFQSNCSMESMVKTLKWIHSLLKPFAKVAENFQKFPQQPTIHLALIEFLKLRKFLGQCYSNEPIESTEAKRELLAKIDMKIQVPEMYKLAVCFWPNHRHLLMIQTNEERVLIYSKIRRLLRKCFQVQSNSSSHPDELSFYLSNLNDDLSPTKHDKICDENSILDWWGKAQNLYPQLSQLARSILSIPASLTLLSKHSKLRPNFPIDDRLVFLHCNSHS